MPKLATRIAPLCLLAALAACQSSPFATDSSTGTVVMNITSGREALHDVTMALQLARHAVDDSRTVVLFFNVRGVDVPVESLPADLAFHDKPIKSLLLSLIERGAVVMVCPHCMKAKGVADADLIEGAAVASRGTLFARLGPDTVVFTY